MLSRDIALLFSAVALETADASVNAREAGFYLTCIFFDCADVGTDRFQMFDDHVVDGAHLVSPIA